MSIQATTGPGIDLHHMTGTLTNVTSTPSPSFVVDQNVAVTTAGTTPNFTWTFPANPTNYTYQFNLSQESGCSGSCTIWQIPGQNSNSNGFTFTETETGASTGQLTWGVDPTGGGSTPTGNLNSADDYYWQITVQDSNGNQAQSSANDNNP